MSQIRPQCGWALVTGASAGIGTEFCRQLAARGHPVILTARRRERLEGLAGELRDAHGVDTRVIEADLADPAAPAAIATELEREGIVPEWLVNNAGYGLPGRFTTPDWSEHEAFLRVMVASVCELCWRLLPAMQRRGRGHVVNVASLAALVPGSDGHTLYAASKAFLVRFSESLALENAPHGVKVSALCPGFTYSEFHDVTGTREQVSRMPGWMWQSAAEVVAFGIESVTRDPPRVVAVSGRVNRFIAGLARHAPGLANRLVRKQSKRFRRIE